MAPRTIESVRTFLANPEEIRRIEQLVHSFIYEDMAECGDEAFALLTNEYGKAYLAIDKSAEAAFAVEIKVECGAFVDVIGEESLHHSGLDLSGSSKIHVLCDVIDGTDLFVKGLANWCSAFVAFEPSRKRIISSHVYVVGGDVDTLYSAAEHSESVVASVFRTVVERSEPDRYHSKQELDDRYEIVTPMRKRGLENASIFSYGQKLDRIEAISRFLLDPKVKESLLEYRDARFYNLGGNPILCKLLDGDADILFEIFGQAAHDFVPGAYIALRGGAFMFDLGNNPVRPTREILAEDLAEYLLRPCSGDTRVKYLVATSKELASDFLRLLGFSSH